MYSQPAPRARMVLQVAALALLAACATFPELGGVPADTSAAAPKLVPIETLLVQADGADNSPATDLAVRAARLRARAALMRGPVLEPATRARLAEAIRVGRA